MTNSIFQVITELQKRRQPFAVATVVDTFGSVSAKTSSKAVIDERGRIVSGWVGGGCAESTACEQAVECINTASTAILDIDLDDELLGAGMPCGGGMRVYIEPILPDPTLWLMGHGRVAEAICIMADLLGLQVVVNDPGAEWEKFPAASQLITDDLDYSRLNPEASDYVVIATQHKGDHESIARALKSDAHYIALIASRKRSGLVLDYLQESGFDDNALARVNTPCGLDLGATKPEEIALSILAEITLLRRGGTGEPLHQVVKPLGNQVEVSEPQVTE